MSRPAGYFTDDKDRKRPISRRVSNAGSSDVENAARKQRLQRKFKSTPAKERSYGEFSPRTYHYVHPVFMKYMQANYKAKGNLIPESHYYTVEPSDKTGEKWKLVLVLNPDDKQELELYPYEILRLGSIYKDLQEKGDPESVDKFLKEYVKLRKQVMWEGAFYNEKEEYEALEVVPSPNGKGYTLAHRMDGPEAFLYDVEQARVKDKNGLKLSMTQVQGLPPEGSFIHSFEKKVFPSTESYDKKDKIEDIEKGGYYVGLVVKLHSTFDSDLSKFHNHYAVITNIVDDYHYEVVTRGYENAGREKLIIRDSDVKGWMGDYKKTFRGDPAVVQGFAEEIMRSHQ